MAEQVAESLPDELKPTLHHLNNSQSQRVLWLLEELAIPYNLVLHKREPTLLAPPALKALSTQGKAPILITSTGVTITESTAIIGYLLKTYDRGRKFRLTVEDEESAGPNWLREETAISLAQSTISTASMINLLHSIAEKRSPFGISYLVGLFAAQFKTLFIRPELKKAFTVIENMLKEKAWLGGGENPGRADFVVSWSVDFLSQNKVVDFENDFPAVERWRVAYQSRAAYVSALEKGNGYKLGF